MAISANMSGDDFIAAEKRQVAPISFNQYNYSPKALRRIDIYRDTKNLLNSIRGR